MTATTRQSAERALQRTAKASIAAAAVLVALKLGTGLATGSLGLVSAGIESLGDLVAAVMTFLAVRIGSRPADRNHPFGHRRLENISALGEAVILSVGGFVVTITAIEQLAGGQGDLEAAWYVFAVIALAIAIDISRISISLRTSRASGSAALRANAFHFAGDLAGSIAVLIGLGLVAAGWQAGDAVAALVVAVIIFAAAGRLLAENANVLMDRTPEQARASAETAIASEVPDVQLRRLRLRESAGRFFADVTVAVPPTAAVVEGHAAADRVEDTVQAALPGADVVVHIEPHDREDVELRQRVMAIAIAEPHVREVHDIAIFTGGERPVVSMHLKFDEGLPLAEAHTVSDRIEQALYTSEDLSGIRTHLEPLEQPVHVARAAAATLESRRADIAREIVECTGREPRNVELLETVNGAVLLTTVVTGDSTLVAAHDHASRLESRLRERHPDLAEVVVHTEPEPG